MLKNYTIEIGDRRQGESVRTTVLSVSEDEVRLGVETSMDIAPSGPQANTDDTDEINSLLL